jgi:hypothetical protein
MPDMENTPPRVNKMKPAREPVAVRKLKALPPKQMIAEDKESTSPRFRILLFPLHTCQLVFDLF